MVDELYQLQLGIKGWKFFGAKKNSKNYILGKGNYLSKLTKKRK